MVPTNRAMDGPRPARPGMLLAVAALAAAAGGCGTAEVPVLFLLGGDDAGPAMPDAALPSLGTKAEYCAGSGPPLLVDAFADGGTVSTCPDQLVQRAFPYALCTCGEFVSEHGLVTDAFDGSQGAYDPSTAMAAGSVGVNGELHPGPMQIGGSLWASSAMSITTTSTVQVSGDLNAEGEMFPGGTLDVGGDAGMANGIQSMSDVTIGGTLDVPTGAPFDVSGTPTFGARVSTPFQVAPACACEPSELVDVAGVVATYEAHNDDEALGVNRTSLENVQAAVTMTLPCGRIYFTSIAANQVPIQLTATGRVAIFVGGDISTTSDFQIEVAPGAEVDLFVAGTVTVGGSFQVGDTTYPARARTYVGGPTVNLLGGPTDNPQSAATLAGNLYAPSATLDLGGSATTTLYGSIFASSLIASADLMIHYDDAILTQSSTPACPAP